MFLQWAGLKGSINKGLEQAAFIINVVQMIQISLATLNETMAPG